MALGRARGQRAHPLSLVQAGGHMQASAVEGEPPLARPLCGRVPASSPSPSTCLCCSSGEALPARVRWSTEGRGSKCFWENHKSTPSCPPRAPPLSHPNTSRTALTREPNKVSHLHKCDLCLRVPSSRVHPGSASAEDRGHGKLWNRRLEGYGPFYRRQESLLPSRPASTRHL